MYYNTCADGGVNKVSDFRSELSIYSAQQLVITYLYSCCYKESHRPSIKSRSNWTKHAVLFRVHGAAWIRFALFSAYPGTMLLNQKGRLSDDAAYRREWSMSPR